MLRCVRTHMCPKELKNNFNPPVYKCANCNDIVYSKYSGEFATCTCFQDRGNGTGFFVDSTHHYTRYGGNINHMINMGDLDRFKEQHEDNKEA